MSLVFILYMLGEIFDCCNCIVVMCDGQLVLQDYIVYFMCDVLVYVMGYVDQKQIECQVEQQVQQELEFVDV